MRWFDAVPPFVSRAQQLVPQAWRPRMHCAGSKRVHEHVLGYAADFLRAYKADGLPRFERAMARGNLTVGGSAMARWTGGAAPGAAGQGKCYAIGGQPHIFQQAGAQAEPSRRHTHAT